MATAAKLAANRVNATHSTGPADTSRTRFNGLPHGLTSKQTVIRGEHHEAFNTFRHDLLQDLNPGSEIEKILAERIAAAAWRLQRFTRMEAAFFNNRIDAYLEANPEAEPEAGLANLFVDPAEASKLRLFLRYQTTVQREYDKAVKEFDKARADRCKQAAEEAAEQAIQQAYLAAATQTQQSPEPFGGFALQDEDALSQPPSYTNFTQSQSTAQSEPARYTGL